MRHFGIAPEGGDEFVPARLMILTVALIDATARAVVTYVMPNRVLEQVLLYRTGLLLLAVIGIWWLLDPTRTANSTEPYRQ